MKSYESWSEEWHTLQTNDMQQHNSSELLASSAYSHRLRVVPLLSATALIGDIHSQPRGSGPLAVVRLGTAELRCVVQQAEN